MPTYEYECVASGKRFERFQSMRDEPLKVCPECGGEARRLISGGAGLIFKGEGFYATDSRNSSRRGTPRQGRTCCGRETPCDVPPCRR
jgi:putative FmdB family regulatory protein